MTKRAKQECMASAKLFAAAHDLLEALKEVVEAADGGGWEQLDPALKKQRAAVEKATRGTE